MNNETSIIRVIGGLGNQMFQYAFYLYMLKKTGNAKLDINDFDSYTLHNGFELSSVFCCVCDEMIATLEEIDQKKDFQSWFRVRKWIGRLFCGNPRHFIKDSHYLESHMYRYDKYVCQQKGKYLDGYWQNEKYFSDFREELRKLFSWQILKSENIELSKKMNRENSVAFHIRRLDQPKTISEWFFRLRLLVSYRACSKKYYRSAMYRVISEVPNPVFYIFTDNIKWVRANINFGSDVNVTVVDWNRGQDSYQDMFLMSQCKHNIISASSFSWWGAWLNEHPNKTIIAPKKWATRLQRDVYIIPEDWTVI